MQSVETQPSKQGSGLRVYSTLTRKMEDFEAATPGKVSMYACGVTVYDDSHLGHARQAIVFDIIRRYLESVGHEVTYVRNFTDVDDKIIARAREKGVSPLELSKHYIAATTRDFDQLKIRRATHEPKVSDCIPDIIRFIEDLIKKGFAYQSGGDVLFDVARFPEYGKLSNRRLDDCLNSDESEFKRNPQDFALWKGAKEGEPWWESPWGKGRPGWHIECSAMASKFLGESIDLHGGGVDLVFPHHENEIAQTEARTGRRFARYWLHNGLVNVNGQKMSKSLGNHITIEECLKRHHREVIRFAVLSQTFTSGIDFSEELFRTATKRVYYFYRTLARMGEAIDSARDKSAIVEDKEGLEIADSLHRNFINAMNDNFNTGAALASLSSAFSKINEILDAKEAPQRKAALLSPVREEIGRIGQVLGFLDEDPAGCIGQFRSSVLREQGIAQAEIEEAIRQRREAKTVKNYAEADKIREQLRARSITLRDAPGGKVEWDIIID